MASSTAIIALLVVARNHIESITQQICAKPCSKANPRDFRNPALLEMSQRYAITQTKSQLFLNFTHLRTTNAIGYQRFDLEKSGTNLRVGQKRLGKLGGDVFATRRFAIACDSRPYSCCKICAIPVNSCQNRGGRPTTSRQNGDLDEHSVGAAAGTGAGYAAAPPPKPLPAPPRMPRWTSPPWPAGIPPPPAPRPPMPPDAVVDAAISVVEPPSTVPESV